MSIRNFKLWNADRTSSFDLSQTGITVTSPKGFGNKFSNTIQSGNRSRRYLTDQKNDFEDISFKVLFGLKAKNAYGMYHQLSSFIQDNQRNEMILEYTRNSETLYVDVALKQFTKTEKSQFNVLEESITFERLSPFYSIVKRTGKEMLIQNNYIENILPKITLKDNSFSAPINVKLKYNNLLIENGNLPITTGGITVKLKDHTYYCKGIATGNPTTIDMSTLGILASGTYYISFHDLVGLGDVRLRVYENGIYNGHTMYTSDNIYTYEADGSSSVDFKLVFSNNVEFEESFKVMVSKMNSNDVPVEDFNGLTRNKIFKDNQVANNNNFDGQYFWNDENGLLSINNGIGTLIGSGGATYSRINQNNAYFLSDRLYINYKIRYTYSDYQPTEILMRINSYGSYDSYLIERNPVINEWYLNSDIVENITNQVIYIGVYRTGANLTVTVEFDYINIFDIGNLDIIASKETLDNQYSLFTNPQPLDYTTPTDYTQSLIINATLNDYDELIIDSESKEITLNNENAYDLLDKANDTFIVIPPGDYVIEADQEITVEYKKWVID